MKDKYVRKRLTPEEVASVNSMHPKDPNLYKTDKWASLKGNKNAVINPKDRTPQQQRNYVRNLHYRIKYRKKREYLKLVELNKQLDRIDPIISPYLYAKIMKNIQKSEEKLIEILSIEDEYVGSKEDKK